MAQIFTGWRAIVFLRASTLVILLGLAFQLPGDAQSAPAQPAPFLDNVDLMDMLVKPAYDELQQAIATAPADRKAWAGLYQRSARLAEITNLLFLRTRAEPARRLEWAARAGTARQAAGDLATAALGGLRNARQSDFEMVRGKLPDVAAACSACHRAFSREAPIIRPQTIDRIQ